MGRRLIPLFTEIKTGLHLIVYRGHAQLLIDELESALHVSVLDSVLAVLKWAAEKYNVQVFATTHSLEAVDAVLKAFKQTPENLVAYRLGRKASESVVTRYPGHLLKETRYEMGFEIR